VTLLLAHRTRPCRGETRSGDAVLVRNDSEVCLLAVIDVLGHGPGAATVAEQALSFLSSAPLLEGVRPLVEGLHQALFGTRGAAATLCLLRSGALEAAGVGNVSVRLFGTKLAVLLSPGILGGRLRGLRVSRGELRSPTRLLLHSDGIRAEHLHDRPPGTPAEACDAILTQYGGDHDDATILIADIS